MYNFVWKHTLSRVL